MDNSESVCILPMQNERIILHIFDALNPPRLVSLDSFGKREITFGRKPDRDIILFSPLVSRVHGRFIQTGDRWLFQDQNSTNGFVYNGANTDEGLVETDNFIRVDDGVETVPDGVLILFGTPTYSDIWQVIPASAWHDKYGLTNISPYLTAAMEKIGEEYSLVKTIQNTRVQVNREPLTGRLHLHEKDVISVPGCRVVFTKQALYVNFLIEPQ